MSRGVILTKEIRNAIESNGPNKLYMVQDFAYLNNDGLVTRALSRLEKEGSFKYFLRSNIILECFF